MVKSFYSTQPGTQKYYARIHFGADYVLLVKGHTSYSLSLSYIFQEIKGDVTEHVHLIFLTLGFLCYVCRSLAVKIGIFYLAFRKKILSVYIDCNFSLFNIRHEMIYFSLNEANLSQCE